MASLAEGEEAPDDAGVSAPPGGQAERPPDEPRRALAEKEAGREHDEEREEEEEEEEEEDTEAEDVEAEEDGVEVVLAAIAAAQRRRSVTVQLMDIHQQRNVVRVVRAGSSTNFNNSSMATEEEEEDAREDGDGEAASLRAIGANVERRTPMMHFPSYAALGRSFACVRHLLLDANHLPSIPDDLGLSFPNLEGLVLTNERRLSVIPPLLFAHLPRLESLSITKTSLATLPPTVSQLTSLRILQLSSNKLTSLPHSIGYLPSLEQLYCTDNLLTDIPSTIGRLTSLQILFLDDNDLSYLPAEIAGLSCSQHSFTFSVRNNPFLALEQSELFYSSVSSLLDLCCCAVMSLMTESQLEPLLPEELLTKLKRESRLCYGCRGQIYGSGLLRTQLPSRLGDQYVVLEGAYCSTKCINYQEGSPHRHPIIKGSESMEELPTL